VADELRPIADGKVLIDVTNPLTPDYSAVVTAGGPSAAEQIAERVPAAHVAKAFNTLFASVQADPRASGQPADALFATDDDDARATLFALLESLGFRPVDVGALARARELEAMAFLNISVQMRHGGDWTSAYVLTGAPRAATSVPAMAAA
jgi:predicted dinucleotide-binding enzyme